MTDKNIVYLFDVCGLSLEAMRSLDNASDSFGYDSAKSVVSYFLANASGYRGDTAKAHKAALKAIVGLK